MSGGSFELPTGARAIPLTRGLFAVVDEADFEWLSQWKWRADNGGPGPSDRRRRARPYYAIRSERVDGCRRTIKMHRVILECDRDQIVDHVNCDGLDNRRANLRVATKTENCRNSRPPLGARFKGVKARQLLSGKVRWEARLRIAGREIYLGRHNSEVEAAAAYDRGARQNYGEFARLNFPVAA